MNSDDVQLFDEPTLFVSEPVRAPVIRLWGAGRLVVEAPATIVHTRFEFKSSGAHPAPLWLEHWYGEGEPIASIQTTSSVVPGARALANPSTIQFLNCVFVSDQPWAEFNAGLIAMLWVNSEEAGRIPKPFKVRFENCRFIGKSIAFFDGHPNKSGLNRQVDVEFDRCVWSINLDGDGNEPNDPHAAVLKSSRGCLVAIDCAVTLRRPGALREVGLQAFSCSDGILHSRLLGGITDGLSYDVEPQFTNGAVISGVTATLTACREHNRNCILGCTGMGVVSGTLMDDVRCAGIVQYPEEYNGRTPPAVSGSEGYTHGTDAGSMWARRWVEWHP